MLPAASSHRRHVRCRRIGVVAVAAGTLLGCDGAIRVDGVVYEWLNPPADARSEIRVDATPTEVRDLRPLSGAILTLLHGRDYRGVAADSVLPRPDGLFQETDSSRTDGSFQLFGVTAPRRFWAALRVEAEGFLPASVVFEHDTVAHRAHVTLVRRRP